MEKKIRDLESKVREHDTRLKKLEESGVKVKTETAKIETTETGDIPQKFQSLDLLNYGYIYNLSGLDLYLAIILIAKEKIGIDGLSPPEISTICRDKIRTSQGVNRSTVSNALSGAGALVDRVNNPRGRGFVYRIMREGEKALKALTEKPT